MSDRAVITLLYRSILRWNRQLTSVPVDLRPAHVEEVLPGFRNQYNGNFGSIRNLAQYGFRQEVAGTTSIVTVRLSYAEAYCISHCMSVNLSFDVPG